MHTDEQVILLLAQDKRPDKPVHPQFTPKMWSLTKRCWEKKPDKRPDIAEVLRKLESGSGGGIFSVLILIVCLLKRHAGRNLYGLLAASLSAIFNS